MCGMVVISNRKWVAGVLVLALLCRPVGHTALLRSPAVDWEWLYVAIDNSDRECNAVLLFLQ